MSGQSRARDDGEGGMRKPLRVNAKVNTRSEFRRTRRGATAIPQGFAECSRPLPNPKMKSRNEGVGSSSLPVGFAKAPVTGLFCFSGA